MREGVASACLIGILWATPAYTQADTTSPASPPSVVDEKELQQAAYCQSVKDNLAKWSMLLRMQDWSIRLYCVEVPPWETKEDVAALRGSSNTDASAKIVAIWVQRDDPDPEHVAIHELLHGLINYAIEAQSHTVEENTVLALADILDAYDDALRVHEKTEKRILKALEQGSLR